MPVKSWKRAQVLGTRAWLIETATKLFGDRGYAGTPLEELVAQAGLTRGAVYHHFKDKRALFEAVVDGLLHDVVNEVERRTLKRAVERGEERESDAIEFFLEALCDGPTHRILSVDGPAVLTRQRWSELMSARLLEPLRRAVMRASERGHVPVELVSALTHLLFGAVQEAALLIGQRGRAGPRREAEGAITKPQVDRALGWMLERFLGAASG